MIGNFTGHSQLREYGHDDKMKPGPIKRRTFMGMIAGLFSLPFLVKGKTDDRLTLETLDKIRKDIESEKCQRWSPNESQKAVMKYMAESFERSHVESMELI